MHASSAIRIGYCLSLTGALAGNGQSARLAHEIWREDVNRSGGLLGRPVELICYDDGTTEASRVEGLYRRLLDDEQVDLVVGGYGTNTLRPAMPLVIDRRRFFVGLMGLGVNRDVAYPGYFAMIPTGPDASAGLTEGFFAVAAAQSPRPTTVALVTMNPDTGHDRLLCRLEKYDYQFRPLGLAVSPDGMSVFYVRRIRDSWDLMLIENFR